MLQHRTWKWPPLVKEWFLLLFHFHVCMKVKLENNANQLVHWLDHITSQLRTLADRGCCSVDPSPAPVWYRGCTLSQTQTPSSSPGPWYTPPGHPRQTSVHMDACCLDDSDKTPGYCHGVLGSMNKMICDVKNHIENFHRLYKHIVMASQCLHKYFSNDAEDVEKWVA